MGSGAYAGVIFDFNGTLFWDTDKHKAAWEIMACRLRNSPLDSEEAEKYVYGRMAKTVIEYLMGGPVKDSVIAEVTRAKEEIYREMCLKDRGNLTLAPGAASFLDFLKQNRVPMTIATGAEKSNLDFYVAVFGLETWFDLDRIVFDDGTIPSKPEPDVYLKASEKIGINPGNCIVFEDAVSGFEAALRAGIGRIVAVGPSERHSWLISLPGVDEVIADFKDFDRKQLVGK